MRKYLRFGLRFLFLVLTGLCILLALEVNRARRHEQATKIVVREGGTIRFTPRFSDAPQDQSNWTVRRSGDSGESLIEHFLSRPWKVTLHCDQDAAVAVELPNLKGLRVVSIFANSKKNDDFLQHVQKCKDLTDLRFYGSYAADYETVQILKRMQQLKGISLSYGHPGISAEAVEELRAALPDCEITKRPPRGGPLPIVGQ